MRTKTWQDDRIVITGIGLQTSLGAGREETWQAMQRGQSGVRELLDYPALEGRRHLGAVIDVKTSMPGELRNFSICRDVAAEAIEDSGLDMQSVDRNRFGCTFSAHIGDLSFVTKQKGREDLIPKEACNWFDQLFPSTASAMIAREFDLRGVTVSNSAACASGTVGLINAVRSIRDGACDRILCGSGEVIYPVMLAGFTNMRVLAKHEDPTQASRPFDKERSGFVMGEGGAAFVLERLSSALERGALIYAEVLGGQVFNDPYHVTSLNMDGKGLTYLIKTTLKQSGLSESDIAYINAHGTGTAQNDVLETRGIRQAFGKHADALCVSSSKSMIGHLVNAAGSVELAVSAIAMRDGFAPPTINLTNPDPDCDLDYTPLFGHTRPLEHSLKLSIAFGGHLAAVVLRRWCEAGERTAPAPVSTIKMPAAAMPVKTAPSEAASVEESPLRRAA